MKFKIVVTTKKKYSRRRAGGELSPKRLLQLNYQNEHTKILPRVCRITRKDIQLGDIFLQRKEVLILKIRKQ